VPPPLWPPLGARDGAPPWNPPPEGGLKEGAGRLNDGAGPRLYEGAGAGAEGRCRTIGGATCRERASPPAKDERPPCGATDGACGWPVRAGEPKRSQPAPDWAPVFPGVRAGVCPKRCQPEACWGAGCCRAMELAGFWRLKKLWPLNEARGPAATAGREVKARLAAVGFTGNAPRTIEDCCSCARLTTK
jgi:hypothetical protein